MVVVDVLVILVVVVVVVVVLVVAVVVVVLLLLVVVRFCGCMLCYGAGGAGFFRALCGASSDVAVRLCAVGFSTQNL